VIKTETKIVMSVLLTIYLLLASFIGCSFASQTVSISISTSGTIVAINYASIPQAFTSTGGWFINGAEPTMDIYPVTYAGQTAIKVSPNANYQSTHSSDVSELDCVNIQIAPSNVIDFSGYVYTEPSYFSDNTSKDGVILGIDMYYNSNRICEISTNDGSTYPSDPIGQVTNQGCYIGANSQQWVYFHMHFTVRSSYLADGSNPPVGYVNGTSHVPNNCIPFFNWVSWGVSDYTKETARFYVTNTTFTITTGG
jgi:hypothetical protein